MPLACSVSGPRRFIDSISASHPRLRLGFSNQFMNRADGWPGLRARYYLPQADVKGLEHDLAYRALANGEMDVTDYSTDGEIRYYDLRVRDDRGCFPDYEVLYRAARGRATGRGHRPA
jgi:osmoprotectant transport system permease protein